MDISCWRDADYDTNAPVLPTLNVRIGIIHFNSKIICQEGSAGTQCKSRILYCWRLMKASSISNAVNGIVFGNTNGELIGGYGIVVGRNFQLEIQGSFNLAVNDVVIAMYSITHNPKLYYVSGIFLVRDSLTVITNGE